MTLKRLDAIATGVLALVAGSAIVSFGSGLFWESWQQTFRQKQTVGTVVALEPTKVCRRTERGNPFKCLRFEKVQCPIVQYQPPEAKQPLKLKDCNQTASVGMVFDVMYDSSAPADARLVDSPDSMFRWVPLFFASVPMGVGGLLLVLGGFKLWEGIRDRQ